MNSCYESSGKIEIWPMPKVGDKFTIDMERPESRLRRFLRRIGLIRKPRRMERRVFQVTAEAESSGEFPAGEYEGWR